MLTVHQALLPAGGSSDESAGLLEGAQLALLFCGESAATPELVERTRAAFPGAAVVGATTAGHIAGVDIHDRDAVATGVRFDDSRIRVASASLEGGSEEAGAALARELAAPDLSLVLVLSEGVDVNGSALVRGMLAHMPPHVPLFGGLSANGSTFANTRVFDGETWAPGRVCAVGFYGEQLQVGVGSMGGWGPFGPDRLVTRSEGNTLRCLDDEQALSLYQRYLAPVDEPLPGSALRFPLSVTTPSGERFVRTVLSVDERDGSMTFAGDVPEGSYARLMRANTDRLVDGAQGAAEHAARGRLGGRSLCLMVSCVGRRMVMKQRTEEELEVVSEVLGEDAVLTGFYSYGEIASSMPGEPCSLHNQTMTVLVLEER